MSDSSSRVDRSSRRSGTVDQLYSFDLYAKGRLEKNIKSFSASSNHNDVSNHNDSSNKDRQPDKVEYIDREEVDNILPTTDSVEPVHANNEDDRVDEHSSSLSKTKKRSAKAVARMDDSPATKRTNVVKTAQSDDAKPTTDSFDHVHENNENDEVDEHSSSTSKTKKRSTKAVSRMDDSSATKRTNVVKTSQSDDAIDTTIKSRSSRRSGTVDQLLSLDLYAKGKLEKNIKSFSASSNHNDVSSHNDSSNKDLQPKKEESIDPEEVDNLPTTNDSVDHRQESNEDEVVDKHSSSDSKAKKGSAKAVYQMKSGRGDNLKKKKMATGDEDNKSDGSMDARPTRHTRGTGDATHFLSLDLYARGRGVSLKSFDAEHNHNGVPAMDQKKTIVHPQ